jgi:hypothetical protein
MKTLLSKEMLDRCIASEVEINDAIAHGKKMQFSDVNGKLTAYLWNGQTYVTELDIIPEAFDDV